ncbi:MarR family transcriptional regulator [Halococcoides cellulosivorans]|nr:helix-turn-helix domain-containing protein [Halococcoides cellulosivorans]
MADDDPPDRRLAEASPSAKFVFFVLEREAPMTTAQIADRTRLSPRTVRNALSRLDGRNLVRERPSFRDARKTLYEPSATLDTTHE